MVKKYPSELSTTTIRINLEDHKFLSDLAEQLSMSIAGVIHFIIVSKFKKNNKEDGQE